MKLEFPDVQAEFIKSRIIRDQIVNIHWIIAKRRRVPEKNIYFCSINYAKAFDYVDHNKLKIRTEIPDHLICLLRNLYAGQESAVRTGHEIMVWDFPGGSDSKASAYRPRRPRRI